MPAQFPLIPEQASEMAVQVDNLIWVLTAVLSVAFVGVTGAMLYFCARYARRGPGERTPRILGSLRLEIAWSVIPLLIFLMFFFWGAWVYSLAQTRQAPADADEVFVTAKQWMWKMQHAQGQREINELHVPIGRAIKLTMISEDVIHSFGVPAFRFKVDVLPGRYTTTWFVATKPGRYHLFCDQYCGTLHSQMVGSVVVMDPAEFNDWQAGRLREQYKDNPTDGSPAALGRQLFFKLQCITCHSANSQARAPVLEGLYGKRVALQEGQTTVVDDAYIRKSILEPRADIVQGWQPIMPTFKGQVTEEDIRNLIAYIRSLRPGETPVRNEKFPAPVGAPTTPAPTTPGGTQTP